jgi:hypothetical protein
MGIQCDIKKCKSNGFFGCKLYSNRTKWFESVGDKNGWSTQYGVVECGQMITDRKGYWSK